MDILNNQFTLEYYFREQNLNLDVFEFMNNNNVKYNYICFHNDMRDHSHTLITSNIKRDVNNGYRIIEILSCEISDNLVISDGGKTMVVYDNIIIKISGILATYDILTRLNIKINVCGNENTKEYMSLNRHYYDKDNDISKILVLSGLNNFRILSVIDCERVHFDNVSSPITIEELKKINLSIFPNLKEIYLYPCKLTREYIENIIVYG
jgi:hypothetical protein